MLRLHVASTSKEIDLVGENMKVIYYLRASYSYSDNKKTTDIELKLTDYEGLFHLMLRLHVASTSNEITLIGDNMKSDLLTKGIMSVLRKSNNDYIQLSFKDN